MALLLASSALADGDGPSLPADVGAVRARAEAGNAEAQFDLGKLYAKGNGVPKDDALAVAWFRKAAEQGHARSQGNLGLAYRDGRGVTRDDVQAVVWFRKAADQGEARAQGFLAHLYAA